MLNLYIGYPPSEFKGVVRNPDRYFKDMDVYEVMSTGFAVRVAKECSDIASFDNPILMRTNSGRFVSPLDLSSGAKNLLIMKYTDSICNLLWCGSNCDKFVEEIAEEKDLTVFTTRSYVPYKRSKNIKPFKVINTGKIYNNPVEYVSDMDIVFTMQEVVLNMKEANNL